MKGTKYTREHIEYLRQIGDKTGRTNQEITDMFNKRFNENRTVNSIIRLKYRNCIRSYTRKYTSNHIKYLIEVSPGKTRKEVVKLFNKKFNDNRTESSIKSIMLENGIKLTSDGRIRKGDIPPNKLPIGTEITRTDGYLYVKTEEPEGWKAKHRILWEEENGPIPAGHIILFGDGNRLNFDMDNLILVSKTQLLQLNRHDLISDNADLTRTGLIIADIYQMIGEKSKKRRG